MTAAATPFEIPVNPLEMALVRQRVGAFRFFEEPVDPDAGDGPSRSWKHGANRDYMERLRTYWLDHYDWPAAVARLNRHPHVRVDVGDGFHLHAIYRRSPRADARPLLIAHGWPGSIVEFDAIIDRLADPEDPSAPAFHVVAPSLPGYGWSDRPKAPLGPRAIAGLYDTLMGCLGHDRYIYQGGDWGCVIGGWVGLDSARVEALHISGFGLRPADMHPETPEDVAWLQKAVAIRETETAYLQLQGTKPQSLGFAMMDSPMGVAAWFSEKFVGWSDVPGDYDDPPFDFDTMLTNIMIYLTTRSFLTATWLYRGMFLEGGFAIPAGRRIAVPTGVASFPRDLLLFPPRPMVERGYNVVHWTDMPRGGHFASLEEPELFLADLRDFVRGL
ncbi:epoxide hydrolase family protein [Polymorphobacter fuscus]|uniref:Alpha/beta fold hydrolase n=1 Tax=Sandarakinorhabdus fusca TaxID=1439888 RepID=A0A7C9KXU3_9SPHN|nr:epoxide hydrolase family protein [Polymorphobacter fuscus]KAB7646234.1 epoxide hydrolase [Polymorphobacter fuscus]MQT17446.1 alpha/beta fold hydrolase [Polymorphobacter fuscus]NJC10017.1 microsomal epoxide hydrolase [Polymorphobacter fuscus]